MGQQTERKLTAREAIIVAYSVRSNRELAKLYGVHHDTVGKIKRGETYSEITYVPKRKRKCVSRAKEMP